MADRVLLDLKVIDQVFRQTLQALQDGKEQLFGISELARSEYDRQQTQLEKVKAEVNKCIAEVDDLEKQLKKAKARLARVSRYFSQENEPLIREAYAEAERLQVQLSVAREREAALRERRDELERSLKNVQEMVRKSEGMVNRVGMAVELMEGNLESLGSQFESLQERYEVAARVIRAQEDERQRVAREIHDGPAQSMANVVLRAEICEKILQTRPGELPTELRELKGLVKGSLQEIRRIIFNLRPMALDDLGLIPTLRRYLEECRKGAVPVRLFVTGKERKLPGTIEVAVFRFVQEAVNNALQHAKANRIAVKLDFSARRLRVLVVDDGIGFDLEELSEQKDDREHFGLLSMKERVQLLQGEFEIHSSPGEGTHVAAEIPLEAVEDISGAETG